MKLDFLSIPSILSHVQYEHIRLDDVQTSRLGGILTMLPGGAEKVLLYGIILVACIVFWRPLARLFGIVYIPDNSIGLVTKKFSFFGNGWKPFTDTELPPGRIIALKGEAGDQADTKPPGLYFGYWPWQYTIELEDFYTIEEGRIGIVTAHDGAALPPGRILADVVPCDSFQDTRAFLENGGQRGVQLNVITPGTRRINTLLFSVNEVEAIRIREDKIGIVTVLDGRSLAQGEIAGPVVDGHSSFQNAGAFISNGGYKGLQEQVLLPGMYYINPEFARIAEDELTSVPVGSCGVVVAYVGKEGQDVSGEDFKHGNLVKHGEKGVWVEPLDPGRYPINTRTHKVEVVPTTNIVLNWNDNKTETHKLDSDLSTIRVRSNDGFEFALDVAQIIHVPRQFAPRVIARFGSMTNLVTQVLEPVIDNYFRNAAQKAKLVDFLSDRDTMQKSAAEHIRKALEEYNIEAVATLMGHIEPPASLMNVLQEREIADRLALTYENQQKAEQKRILLEQTKAEADTRGQVVQAEREKQVAEQNAAAAVHKAEGDSMAEVKRAEGRAQATRLVAEAEATKTKAIGDAEADVLTRKVQAVGATPYALMAVIDSLSKNGVKVVPDVLVAGEGVTSADALLAIMAKAMNPVKQVDLSKE